MEKIKTHLCLISGQPIPNITPLLDKKFAPDTVIFLLSPDMQKKAQWLEKLIKPRGIKVVHWPIDDAWDIEHIQYRIIELLESDYADGLALNATGGTKPMSIGAYSVFGNKPVFYVHPQEDKILWMTPSNRPAQIIEDRLRLSDFLLAHGYSFISGDKNKIPSENQELAQELINNIEKFAKPLGLINFLANKADGRADLTSPIIDSRKQSHDFIELLQLFEDKGVCYFDHNKITFNSEQKRFFANGGWLEEYVFSELRHLSSHNKIHEIRDLQKSVEVQAFDGGTRNELDVAFLSNNHFHVVECKTKTWKEQDSGSDAIYKLDTLKETLGGLQGKGMLITYKELPKAVLQRAKNENIAVCQFSQLKRINEFLITWIQNK